MERETAICIHSSMQPEWGLSPFTCLLYLWFGAEQGPAGHRMWSGRVGQQGRKVGDSFWKSLSPLSADRNQSYSQDSQPKADPTWELMPHFSAWTLRASRTVRASCVAPALTRCGMSHRHPAQLHPCPRRLCTLANEMTGLPTRHHEGLSPVPCPFWLHHPQQTLGEQGG